MSLLMQALKKAEHTKQKSTESFAEALSTGAPLSLQTSPGDESRDVSLRQAEAPSAVSFAPELGLSMEAMEPADVMPVAPAQRDKAIEPAPAVTNDPEEPVRSTGGQAARLEAGNASSGKARADIGEHAAPSARSPRRGTEAARASLDQSRQAAQARTVARTVLTTGRRPAIGRVAIIGGIAVLLAAFGVGGFYVWQTAMQPSNTYAVPAAPVVPTAGLPISQNGQPAIAGGAGAEAPRPAAAPLAATGTVTPILARPTGVELPKGTTDAGSAAAQSAAPPTSAVTVGESSETPPIQVRQTSTAARVDPALAAAYQAFEAGEPETARQYYQKVLRQDAGNRDALLGMAVIAQNRHQDTEAANYYEKLLERDPADGDAIAGLVSLRQGDSSQDESRLKKVLAQYPQSGAVLFALGNLYSQQSRWAEAQQAYFRAYTSAPGNANYAFNLAVSLDRLNQGRLALDYYRKALSSKHSNFDRTAVQARIVELQAIE